MAKRAETAMAMDDFDLLADADIAQYGEEGEDGGKGRRPVDDEEGHMVDLEAVVEVANALAVVVVVGDDDDFVASVDELAGELVDVRFDAAGLGEEEVADHGDVVCFAPHFEGVVGINSFDFLLVALMSLSWIFAMVILRLMLSLTMS